MNKVKVGVVIPVYNGEKVLKAAVESVFAQTLKDWELIIVNDGSTDGTSELANGFARLDSRIRVIHQENHGPYMARVNGMLKLNADYFTSLDADDVIHPQMLERMYGLAVKESLDLVECDLSVASNNSKEIDILKGKENVREKYLKPVVINGNGFMCVCGKLYRSELLRSDGELMSFVDGRVILFEDVLFNIQILYKVSSYARIHYPYYNYDISDDSSVRNFHPSVLPGFVLTVMVRNSLASLYGISSNDVRLSKWVVSNALNLVFLASYAQQRKWYINARDVKEVLNLSCVRQSITHCESFGELGKKGRLLKVMNTFPSILVVVIVKLLRRFRI